MTQWQYPHQRWSYLSLLIPTCLISPCKNSLFLLSIIYNKLTYICEQVWFYCGWVHNNLINRLIDLLLLYYTIYLTTPLLYLLFWGLLLQRLLAACTHPYQYAPFLTLQLRLSCQTTLSLFSESNSFASARNSFLRLWVPSELMNLFRWMNR